MHGYDWMIFFYSQLLLGQTQVTGSSSPLTVYPYVSQSRHVISHTINFFRTVKTKISIVHGNFREWTARLYHFD